MADTAGMVDKEPPMEEARTEGRTEGLTEARLTDPALTSHRPHTAPLLLRQIPTTLMHRTEDRPPTMRHTMHNNRDRVPPRSTTKFPAEVSIPR